MKKYLLALIALGLLLACETSSDDSTSQSGNVENLPIKPDEIQDELLIPIIPAGQVPLELFGAYATSTATGSNLSKVFDENPNTFWRTIGGTGPDEGIMLYFKKAVYIQSVEINSMNGKNFANPEEITIYGNGSPINVGAPGELISIDSLVANLYIRFSKIDHTETMSSQVDGFYNTFRRDSFSIRHSVGIREISITGEGGEIYKIIPPQKVKGVLEASSILSPEHYAYDVNNLFDARKEFVWVEGVDGHGIGEVLTFDFENEKTIQGFWIWNGYQRSQSHYDSNSRLKSIRFGLKGDSLSTYKIRDVSEPQFIDLGALVKGKTFELQITEAYNGWSYKDLAISELLFINDKGILFGMNNNKATEIQKSYQAKAGATILENILDRRIYNLYENEDEELTYLERSIILRSDGTFVFYTKEEDSFDTIELIADGNWEIESANAEEAKLKIFGKLLDFSNLELYYAGDSEVELSRIFRDELTIRGNYIRGEKFLVEEIVF